MLLEIKGFIIAFDADGAPKFYNHHRCHDHRFYYRCATVNNAIIVESFIVHSDL